MENRILKPISGFPGYYINKNGRIWSGPKSSNYNKHGKFLNPSLAHEYFQVRLYKNKKYYNRRVHRLVLETFVGPCPDGMETCHNNGIHTDNRLENLRWDTHSNNQKDSVKHGTHNFLK